VEYPNVRQAKVHKKTSKSTFGFEHTPVSALKRKSLHVVSKVERNKRHRRNLLWVALWAGLTVALAGCGRQAFIVGSASQTATAGTFTMPAKVDILLAEDNSGSIKEIYGTIAQQTTGFLKKLEANKAWDYHFATIPMTSDRVINQVVASKYDSNWGAAWLPPFPGALPGAPGTLPSNIFRTLLTYSGFLSQSDINSFNNGQEPTFEKIRKALYENTSNTFLRPDALLVIIAMGNGNDTSGVTYCKRSDGYLAQAEQLSPTSIIPNSCVRDGQSVAYAQTGNSSLSNYQTLFENAKLIPGMTKFYSVVSQQTGYCLGSNSFAGTRYNQMALNLGGGIFNICYQSISTVLDQMAASLHATRLGFRQRFVPLPHQPEVSTIKVTKSSNGQTITIPQDAVNGWTYAGYLTDVPLIEWPTEMNKATGFMIELHGSAKIVGDEVIDIQSKPAGVSNSI
jgi:hypothetical protein